MPPIRVLLVDDHILFRRGVAELLARERDFELVAEASDGLEAAEEARRLRPDVVLVGASTPRIDAFLPPSRVEEASPRARIVLLTDSEDERNRFEAVGASGPTCLERGIEPPALLDVLRGLGRGESVVGRTPRKGHGDVALHLPRTGPTRG